MSSPVSSLFHRPDPVQSIVLMFALTQLLGVSAGILLVASSPAMPDLEQIKVTPIGHSADPLNAAVFIAYVLFGAGAVLLVLHFYKGPRLFQLLEFSVVSGSVSVLLFAYLRTLLGIPFFDALGLSSMAGVTFGILKFLLPGLKNSAAILSSAGVGAMFGFSMGFWPALLFILGLSLYDYIAVFRTRHMLVLAQALGTRNLSFTITAESRPKKEEKIIAIAAPHTVAKGQSAPSPVPASPPAQPAAHPAPPRASSGVERLDLGSGDLSVPAMLAVSSYTIAGLPGALAVALGSTISIYVLLQFVVEKRVALPALPPICMGGLLALLAILLIGG